MSPQSQPRSRREGQLGTEIISWKRTVAVLQRGPLGSSAGILIFTTSLSPPKSAPAARLPADCAGFSEPLPQLIRNARLAVSRPQGRFFQLSRLRVLPTEPKRQGNGSLKAPHRSINQRGSRDRAGHRALSNRALSNRALSWGTLFFGH